MYVILATIEHQEDGQNEALRDATVVVATFGTEDEARQWLGEMALDSEPDLTQMAPH